MPTWVLMVMVLYGSAHEPRGITSVPGFKTQGECELAGAQVASPGIFKEPSLMSLTRGALRDR
jgi:hypothetical protein